MEKLPGSVNIKDQQNNRNIFYCKKPLPAEVFCVIVDTQYKQ